MWRDTGHPSVRERADGLGIAELRARVNQLRDKQKAAK